MKWINDFVLRKLLGFAESELAANSNRIRVAISGAVIAGLVKLVGLINPSFVGSLGPAFQQFADWLANVILAGAASVITAWTVRAPGAPAINAGKPLDQTPPPPPAI